MPLPTHASLPPFVLDPPPTPAWLTVARRYRGVAEVAGAGSHPTILGWARRSTAWIRSYFVDDDIPWCALFVNACLEEVGLVGTRSLAAKRFLTWGVSGTIAPGAILVFDRPGGGGHVGFYVGQRLDGALRVLGGNQGNRVSEAWLDRGRLLSVRWPSTALSPVGTYPVVLAATGEPLSGNEV